MTFEEFQAKVGELADECPDAPVALKIFPELRSYEWSLVLYIGAGEARIRTVGPLNGTLESVYSGRAVEYTPPKMKRGAPLSRLLDELEPLVHAIANGIGEYWDGSRWRAKWSDEAVVAANRIERILDEYGWQGHAEAWDEWEYVDNLIRYWHNNDPKQLAKEVKEKGLDEFVQEIVEEEFCDGHIMNPEALKQAIIEHAFDGEVEE